MVETLSHKGADGVSSRAMDWVEIPPSVTELPRVRLDQDVDGLLLEMEVLRLGVAVTRVLLDREVDGLTLEIDGMRESRGMMNGLDPSALRNCGSRTQFLRCLRCWKL